MQAGEFIEELSNGTLKGNEVLNTGDNSPVETCNILVNHYQDPKVVNKLINLGTITQLGLNPIPAKNAFSFKNTSSNYLDHNGNVKDKREAPITWENRKELNKDINNMNLEAVTYFIFKNNKWYLIDLDTMTDKPLKDLLLKSHEYKRTVSHKPSGEEKIANYLNNHLGNI